MAGQNEQVKEFVFSRRLAGIAAQLLGVHAVRLYHDQALYKEPAAASPRGTRTSTTGRCPPTAA